MSLQELAAEVRQKLDEANELLAIKRRFADDLTKAEAKLASSAEQLRLLEESSVVISVIEEGQRKELKTKVEKLVSYALAVVFGRDYKFHLRMSKRGRQTEAEFMVEVPEHPGVEIPLKDAHGGGLVSVVAFLLQIIVALSAKPALRKFIVLDEPFSQVSEDYKPALVSFVRELADKTGVQFLIVSHDPELIAVGDKQYRFKLVGGETQVEEVT